VHRCQLMNGQFLFSVGTTIGIGWHSIGASGNSSKVCAAPVFEQIRRGFQKTTPSKN
jgi:hypothetical protein